MKLKLFVLFLIILLAISIGIIFFLIQNRNFYITFGNSISPTPTSIPTPTQTPVPTPTSENVEGNLNKKFVIPLFNSSGDTYAQVEYELMTYEVTNEIIVKGQRATAIEGRAFLIINIKITNTHDQVIKVNSGDFIKLSVNNIDEWRSPDIHNDPVDVQPVSSKVSRVGFPINEADENYRLKAGDPYGEEEIIDLEID